MCGMMSGKQKDPNSGRDSNHAYNWFIDRDKLDRVFYFEYVDSLSFNSVILYFL